MSEALAEVRPVEVPQVIPPAGPPPALYVPAPRLLYGAANRRRFLPARNTQIEVGDLLGRLGIRAAPPSSFTDRVAFAAAFLGCSNVFIEPGRIFPGLRTNPTYTPGGTWTFVLNGDVVPPFARVGPAMIDGVLSAQVLEVVADDEAIGELIQDDGRIAMVKLKGGLP